MKIKLLLQNLLIACICCLCIQCSDDDFEQDITIAVKSEQAKESFFLLDNPKYIFTEDSRIDWYHSELARTLNKRGATIIDSSLANQADLIVTIERVILAERVSFVEQTIVCDSILFPVAGDLYEITFENRYFLNHTKTGQTELFDFTTRTREYFDEEEFCTSIIEISLTEAVNNHIDAVSDEIVNRIN